jgi:hypothetical protein
MRLRCHGKTRKYATGIPTVQQRARRSPRSTYGRPFSRIHWRRPGAEVVGSAGPSGVALTRTAATDRPKEVIPASSRSFSFATCLGPPEEAGRSTAHERRRIEAQSASDREREIRPCGRRGVSVVAPPRRPDRGDRRVGESKLAKLSPEIGRKTRSGHRLDPIFGHSADEAEIRAARAASCSAVPSQTWITAEAAVVGGAACSRMKCMSFRCARVLRRGVRSSARETVDWLTPTLRARSSWVQPSFSRNSRTACGSSG